MEIKTKMMYLGFEAKTSKKTNGQYLLAKFMDVASGSAIYEFYVPSDRVGLITEIGQLQSFQESEVVLKMSSFNNKAQIDLERVAQK